MVFVTGATGLLGSHLLYFLAVSGHSVSALRRKQSRLEDSRAVFLQYPDGEKYWNTINWVEGDVVQKEGLAEYVRRADYVYHCAAVVSFSGTDRMHLMNTNLQGTENVAALCLEYQVRLCYVSSIAALGDARQPEDLIDEDTPVIAGREHSVYSQSKTAAEKLIRKYIGYGLNAVIVCPSVILGAGMWHRSSARLLFTAAKGIPFYTRGMTGYVDVRDVCELMIRLCEDPLVPLGSHYIKLKMILPGFSTQRKAAVPPFPYTISSTLMPSLPKNNPKCGNNLFSILYTRY